MGCTIIKRLMKPLLIVKREQIVGEITWKARQLHITSGSGAVYRLHYWTARNKYIFSNVVSKNDDITICEINEKIVEQIECDV